jgi:uncharacterized membrane protein
MANQIPQEAGPFLNKSRLEALTDGIFAFALTVLVLNIEVPDGLPALLTGNPVQDLIISLVPDFVHYFMAFVVLAGFWFTHHVFFDRIKFVDGIMTWLNILSLLFVALIPFSAQLADTYVAYPLAAMIFELNVLMIGLIFLIQWKYAIGKPDLLQRTPDDDERRISEQRMLVMPGISMIAIVLAIIGFTYSAVLYSFLPFIYFGMGKSR